MAKYTKPTADQLQNLAYKQKTILELVGAGRLDYSTVNKALQNVIDNRSLMTFNWRVPNWWRTAHQQLDRARVLWGNKNLPEPPKAFVPQTPSEVLLLHVPDTFDNLWDMIVPPIGYRKRRFTYDDIRVVEGKVRFTEPVWLAFDTLHGSGISPMSLSDKSRLAGDEVLSAMIQFPHYASTWACIGDNSLLLSAYQVKIADNDWSDIPMIRRNLIAGEIILGSQSSRSRARNNTSPAVRVV